MRRLIQRNPFAPRNRDAFSVIANGAGDVMDQTGSTIEHQGRALWLSTIAFTICFAVWTIFSIIGIRIKQDLGLSDTQFGLLIGTPILMGGASSAAAETALETATTAAQEKKDEAALIRAGGTSA